jgi:hypothetical protein
MPPIFTVKPIFVNDVTGEVSPFYDEVGTPEFYMITHTLQKYLGDHIWCHIADDDPDLFIVHEYAIQHALDEGYDNSEDYRTILENINELNTLRPIYTERSPSTHIRFEIIPPF